MKTRIVRIGNSRGIRIPKPLIEQTGLDGDVEVAVRGNTLVISSARQPRAGWAEAFRAMAVSLDPTVGSEIKKTRPCLVVTPDEMNRHIRTVIVAPMTTKGVNFPRGSRAGSRGKRVTWF